MQGIILQGIILQNNNRRAVLQSGLGTLWSAAAVCALSAMMMATAAGRGEGWLLGVPQYQPWVRWQETALKGPGGENGGKIGWGKREEAEAAGVWSRGGGNFLTVLYRLNRWDGHEFFLNSFKMHLPNWAIACFDSLR